MTDTDSLQELGRWHTAVSARADELAKIHGERLLCRAGCSACCVDDLSVYALEADRIRVEAPDVLSEEPHPPGACAFLDDEGRCRIYAVRPYVCRTQGLPLRWFDAHPEDPDEWVEYRDICPLNDETGAPLESLPESECWTLGEAEAWLSERQKAYGRGRMTRVRLRDLFGPANQSNI